MPDSFDLLKAAYDPENFRTLGHQLIDQLADQLQQMLEGRESGTPAIPWAAPNEAFEYWSKARWDGDPMQLLKAVAEKSVHIHHPRYMGHQLSPSTPLAALAGLVNDFVNNGMGVYEMGIPGSTLERVVVKSVAKQASMPANADGFLTSGGTLANLTALLAARAHYTTVWQDGAGQPLALMVSEEAHYCVDRAVRIMGWGEGGIIKVPVNEQYEMRTDLLPEYLARAKASGRQVIAVVGSACTTSTGSFDDLHAIADFCQANQLWMHVDGAHGAAHIYSEKYHHLVAGLERADTVVMDFHKMLLTPSITTALLFRKGQRSYQTFAQRAQYLWEREEDADWFNLAKRTFECTKSMLSLRAYCNLAVYGSEFFDAYVTRVVERGRELAALVEAHPDFELAVAPRTNIVCFRYRNPNIPEEQRSTHNEAIRKVMTEVGKFYIVKTVLRGQTYLRTTLTNPFTERTDLEALLAEIEQTGQRTAGILMQEFSSDAL